MGIEGIIRQTGYCLGTGRYTASFEPSCDLPGGLPSGEVVIYPADADPVAEADNMLHAALSEAWKLAGDEYAFVVPYGGQFRAITKPSDKYADGSSALAAARALREKLEAAREPCPCESLSEEDWKVGVGREGWEIRTPQATCYRYCQPRQPCPLCGKSLPSKPEEAMSEGECAGELYQWLPSEIHSLRAETTYLPPAITWSICYTLEGVHHRIDTVRYDSSLKAWQAAVRKLRKETSE